ncbi:Lipase class 3-related protein [Raphanus sativus]|uniref:GDSL esterase/lipase At4g10955 n=1 Tax=Raphanus sativus TaxID=3726 RepID=A0A6J0NDW8_RAPSA|nr:GDSL esterase/lipase At4g10955 [Raphanus sativus]XP_056864844.1 GDSL esterase/lipase At4g10955 [Raphanus sativus]XP_056864845.1 GDSL esterase/lipase At4g10955 [Raphanus sativus]XP_056864846.1 GDSL esterase/lipase At4g10955 [Raphanus sativus]KAJ4900460.1 Lipase class 3-related protein [Raphanus sativus]
MGISKKKRDNFSESGPKHVPLTPICWNDSHQVTVVLACLVNGVSAMQRDNSKKRNPRLANSWWESLGFSLFKTLINPDDGSIHGAVYKYNHYNSDQKNPLYVIAFRGVMLSSKTFKSDIKQIFRCPLNILDKGKRFASAKLAIENVLSYPNAETESVWLAGHSLGAGIALLAGKKMARSGSPLKTYAFNPPHSDLLVEQLLDNEMIKVKAKIFRNFIRTSAVSLLHLQSQEDDPRTRAWTPYLYVNPADPICLAYTHDFRHKSEPTIGESKLESDAVKISVRSELFGRRRTPSSPSDFPGEPIQLLSSADMTVNKTASIREAHRLKQWWGPADPVLREYWGIRRIG